MNSRHPPPRIIRIRYRSGVNGRVATIITKVPYGQAYDMTEKLTRLLTQRQIKWFRIDEAKPDEIEAARPTLARWTEALARSVAITRINLES